MIERREELNRIVGKNAEQKIEHAELRKLVRKEIKRDIKKYEESIIIKVMENTGSTKAIKKELNIGKKCWINKIEREDKTILYDRN